MLLAALPSTWRPFVTTQSYQTQSLAILINKMRQDYTFSKLSNNNLKQSTIPITPIKISNASHQIHDTGIQNTLKWHLRLDHPHLQALHKIRTHNLADGIIGPFTHLTFVKAASLGK